MERRKMVDQDAVSMATVKGASRLQLRDDLIIVEQRQSGRPYFVVKDPKNGKLYGFNQASHGGRGARRHGPGPRPFRGRESDPRGLGGFRAKTGGLGLLLGVEAGREPDRPTPAGRLPAWVRNLNPLFIRLPA